MMKPWLITFTATLAALVVFALLAYAAVYYLWWTQPLAEPMHLTPSGLPQGYTPFWALAFAPVYGLATWAAVSLHTIARR